MNILAVADIHGAVDVFGEILQHGEPPDVLLLAGDMTTCGTARDLQHILDMAARFSPVVLAVLGNMDPPELEQVLDDAGVALNGQGITVGAIGFFGISSSPRSPMHTPNEVEDAELHKRATAGFEALPGCHWNIMVSHTPPLQTAVDRVTSGTHVGSQAVRTFIEEQQPQFVFCGHIHEARGMDEIGASRIINCGPAKDGWFVTLNIGHDGVPQLRQQNIRGSVRK